MHFIIVMKLQETFNDLAKPNNLKDHFEDAVQTFGPEYVFFQMKHVLRRLDL